MRLVATEKPVGRQYIPIGADGLCHQDPLCFIVEKEVIIVIGLQADNILQLPERPAFVVVGRRSFVVSCGFKSP